MKKILISALMILVVGLVFADGNKEVIEIATTSSNSVSTATSKHLSEGYIESIYIDVTAPATQTVVVSTTDITLLTASGVTADTMYRPRYTANDAAGGVLQIATNDAVKQYVYGSPISLSVTSTQSNEVPIRVSIITSK